MRVEVARPEHAGEMSVLLSEILRSWNSNRNGSHEHVLAYYIQPTNNIRCSVALDETGRVLGFQSLIRAEVGNVYGVTPGWGVIGTYVRLDAGRGGIGKALFASSLEAARQSGLQYIDATIGDWNEKGLAYYEAVGFRTYRLEEGAICKKFDVQTSDQNN